jgi:hypothetical protein
MADKYIKSIALAIHSLQLLSTVPLYSSSPQHEHLTQKHKPSRNKMAPTRPTKKEILDRKLRAKSKIIAPGKSFQARSHSGYIWEPPTTLTKFLELPENVRKMVYHQVLLDGGHYDRVISAHGTVPELKAGRSTWCLPALCLTNKAEASIATTLYIQNAKFNVCCEWCDQEMLAFLDRLPIIGEEMGRKAVRDLTYDHYGCNPTINDFSFDSRVAQALPNLTNLTVTLSVWDLLERLDDELEGPYRPLTKDEICQKKDFTGISQCPSLKHLWMRVIKAGELHGADVMPGMYATCHDIYNAFMEQGRTDFLLRVNHRHPWEN